MGEYDLMIIQTLKDIEYQLFWSGLNISPEIESQLTQDVSKFERKMQMLSSSSSLSRRRHILTSQMITQVEDDQTLKT